MGFIGRKMELKLDIVESLARCQKALAKIIEGVAEASDATEETPMMLRENIKALAHYQRSIMVSMLGIELGDYGESRPSRPWTNEKLGVIGGGDPVHKEALEP